MKKIIFGLFILTSLSLISFKSADKDAPIGQYGICNCENGASSNPDILLEIKDDHTFSYLDNTVPKKPIKLTGTWKLKGNKVILGGYDSKISIHKKWKFSDKNQCIKSRNKMNFRRICLVTENS